MEYSEYIILDSRDRAGVIAGTVFAAISAISVTILLLHIASVATAPLFRRHGPNNSEERAFLSMQFSVFLICLLLSDLAQAVGGLIQGRWAVVQVIHESLACTVQGVLIEFGNMGTAIWNAVIAAHCFVTIVLGKRMSKTCVVLLLLIGWGVVIMLTILGPIAIATPAQGPFYGVGAPRWCFVRDNYSFQRIMIFYPTLFTSALVILILYSVVFLSLRGTLKVKGWKWTFSSGPPTLDDGFAVPCSCQVELRALARKVLWYPVVYIVLILPIAICRLSGTNPRSPFWPASFCCVILMGCANSLLYAFTRSIGPSPLLSSPILQVFISRVTHTDRDPSRPSSRSTRSTVRDRILNSLPTLPKKAFLWKSANTLPHQPQPISPISTFSPISGKRFIFLDNGRLSVGSIASTIVGPDFDSKSEAYPRSLYDDEYEDEYDDELGTPHYDKISIGHHLDYDGMIHMKKHKQ